MKTLLLKLLLITIATIFILGSIAIAEFLTTFITVNTVMSTVYAALVLGFIYLLKN